jgi:L,D-peptidoglycan transpeptidase YkuD (ErfK/YbiS/YcfS/YnhG family)
MQAPVPNIIVTANGSLRFRNKTYACALGKGGRAVTKIEGDGVTPVGVWTLKEILYRPDRLVPPVSKVSVTPLRPADGWCDDPDHADYNTLVLLPHAASCEVLWRKDAVYDVIVTLGHNDDPVIAGQGSAIFFHVARAGYEPTEGCVALALTDLLEVVELVEPGCAIDVQPAS